MIHPAFILLIGLVCEALVQFSKRSVYWISSASTPIHYGTLLIGDLVFISLLAAMLKSISFDRKHKLIIFVFTAITLFTVAMSGPSAAILSIRNTYIWILATLLFAVSYKQNAEGDPASLLIGATKFLSIILIIFAFYQVQTDYAFEKAWFELSGTSLNYDGVTNFGQAAKAFSLMSGPTDFAVFGLFGFSIGIAGRSWTLKVLGACIILMSGTRGILIAIPAWFLLAFTSVAHVRRNYILSITAFFTLIFIFSNELIALLYALPNSRFSLATLAPRIELWLQLDINKFLTGGGFAANFSSENLTDAPTVIDSGLFYLFTEIGAPLTIAVIYLLLSVAQRDLTISRKGVLQFFIGVLLVASIAQIPLQTRLSNFLICLLIYSGIYRAKNVQTLR